MGVHLELAQDEQRRTAGRGADLRRPGGHGKALGLTPRGGGSPGGFVADSDMLSLILTGLRWLLGGGQPAGAGPGATQKPLQPRGEMLAPGARLAVGWGHGRIRVCFEGRNNKVS